MESKRVLDANKISSLDNIDSQTFALILMTAVSKRSEQIILNGVDRSLRLSDESNTELLDCMGESGYKDFTLDLLARQAREFASIEEGASGPGLFLLRIGGHRLTVSVRIDEAIQILLPGAKEASETARESLRNQLEESKDLILLIDGDGRVVRRRRASPAAGRPATVVLTIIPIALTFLVAGGAIAIWLWDL